jgi:hypothetical protein
MGSILMIIAGIFKLISGIIGLFNDQWLVIGYSGFRLVDPTAHAVWWLLVGVVLLLGGFAALSGKRWGEIVGIVFVSLAAISEFFMIPYFPIWSVFLLVVYVLVLIGFIRAPARGD